MHYAVGFTTGDVGGKDACQALGRLKGEDRRGRGQMMSKALTRKVRIGTSVSEVKAGRNR